MIYVLLGLVSGLFTAAGKFFDWLYARQMVDAGRAAKQVEDLKGQVDAAHKALQARLAVERDQQLNPDGVHDDDGFKRPD